MHLRWRQYCLCYLSTSKVVTPTAYLESVVKYVRQQWKLETIQNNYSMFLWLGLIYQELHLQLCSTSYMMFRRRQQNVLVTHLLHPVFFLCSSPRNQQSFPLRPLFLWLFLTVTFFYNSTSGCFQKNNKLSGSKYPEHHYSVVQSFPECPDIKTDGRRCFFLFQTSSCTDLVFTELNKITLFTPEMCVSTS